jgi:hypothetical protein
MARTRDSHLASGGRLHSFAMRGPPPSLGQDLTVSIGDTQEAITTWKDAMQDCRG